MDEKVKRKGRISNGALVALLVVLVIAIFGLGVGITVNMVLNKDEGSISGGEEAAPLSEEAQELIARVKEVHGGDLLAGDGASVLDEFIDYEMSENDLGYSEAYPYYELMLENVTDPTLKWNYLYHYALFYYDATSDADGAVEIIDRMEPAEDAGVLAKLNYYTILRQIYEMDEDEEMLTWCDEETNAIMASDEYKESAAAWAIEAEEFQNSKEQANEEGEGE